MEDTIPTNVRPTMLGCVERHDDEDGASDQIMPFLPMDGCSYRSKPSHPAARRNSSSSSDQPHAFVIDPGLISSSCSSSDEGPNCVRHTLLLGLEEGLAYRITEPTCRNDASEDRFRSDVSLLVFDLSPLATKHMVEGTLPTLRRKKVAFEPYELTVESRRRFLSSQRLFRRTPRLHAALCDIFFSPVFMIASGKMPWTAVSRPEWPNFVDIVRRLSTISPGFFPDSVTFILRLGWFAIPGGVILYRGNGPIWEQLEGFLS